MNNRVTKALKSLNQLGLAAWFVALEMLVDLVRANIRRLLVLRAPKLIFAQKRSLQKGIRYLEIGNFARLGANSRLSAWPGGKLCIGNNFSLGEHSIVENGFNFAAKKGSIKIGNNVGIGAFSFISCPSQVYLGSDCIIGQYFSIHAQNHNFGSQELIRNQGTSEQGVKIGENCWIGAKVTILDGVSIGDGTVIAAGAVVTESFPPRSLIGGCPAKLIRTF